MQTTRKPIDKQISLLLSNGVQKKQRSVFFLVGEKPQQRVATLTQLLSQYKAKKEILWCYKDSESLAAMKLSSSKRKRQKMNKNNADPEDPFELFLQRESIKWCYYKETHNILGKTFSICVLQDFSAVTPNILARTMQTVEGGGFIIFLVNQLSSVIELHSVAMDVHNKYRTARHQSSQNRFNERFVRSTKDCPTFLAISEEFDVLTITANTIKLEPNLVTVNKQDQIKLNELHSEYSSSTESFKLVTRAKTYDQATVIKELVSLLVAKNLRVTASVIAGRGRGKSVALGLAAAAAINEGFSNIFVTSPSPENVQALFEFVIEGLDCLGYSKSEYQIIQSTSEDFKNCVIRVEVTRQHRQTIQYVSPFETRFFSQAELVVIDEAAALPLPIVRDILGNYMVFISSTVSGYEGTGRALSLKLLKSLKDASVATTGRQLKELTLTEPIRYSRDDPVEAWLNKLLCLDAPESMPQTVANKCCPAQNCELFYVNRDCLFSYNDVSEQFLQRVIWMLVSAHYANQPDNLQLLADAPGQHLFVLCGRIRSNDCLPEVYCVIQVAEEGEVQTMEEDRLKGTRRSGDMLPYTMAQQFQDSSFSKLFGLRIMRIAVHPMYQKMKYGSFALSRLIDYYSGKVVYEDDGGNNDNTLIINLTRLKCEQLPSYIGTSFGVTQQLFSFWKKNGFRPLYMRQSKADITGEHSVMMFRTATSDPEVEKWLEEKYSEFRRRFLVLCGSVFRSLPLGLILDMLVDANQLKTKAIINGRWVVSGVPQVKWGELDGLNITLSDISRLNAFVRQEIDLQTVMDIIPRLAQLYFLRKSSLLPNGEPGVNLTVMNMGILIGYGLLLKSTNELLDSSEEVRKLGAAATKTILTQTLQAFSTYFDKLQALPPRVNDQECQPPAKKRREK